MLHAVLKNSMFPIVELYEKIPKEIIQLGKKAVHFYVQSLTKGEYVNNLGWTMFVGHFGVGKTTLVRGLLQQDIQDIKSTDGIEVHIRKFYYSRDTQEWHFQGKYKLCSPIKDWSISFSLFALFAVAKWWLSLDIGWFYSSWYFFRLFRRKNSLNGYQSDREITGVCRINVIPCWFSFNQCMFVKALLFNFVIQFVFVHLNTS